MSKKVLTTQSLKYPSIYLSILNETNLVTHTKRHSLLDKRDFIREYLDSLDIPTEPQQGPEPILNTLPIEETLRHGNTDEAFIQLSQQQEISSSSKRKQQRDDVSSQLTSSNTQNEEDQNLLGEVPRTGNARGITGVIDSKVDKRCKRLSTVDQACENLNMSKRCKECRTKPKRHAEQELNIGSVDKSKDKVRARNRKRRKRQEEPLASLRDMGYPRRQKRAHSPQECIAASKVEYTDGSESDGGHRHCRMPLQRRQRLQTMLATRRMDARSHSNKPRKIFTQSSLIMNQFVSPKVSKERITMQEKPTRLGIFKKGKASLKTRVHIGLNKEFSEKFFLNQGPYSEENARSDKRQDDAVTSVYFAGPSSYCEYEDRGLHPDPDPVDQMIESSYTSVSDGSVHSKHSLFQRCLNKENSSFSNRSSNQRTSMALKDSRESIHSMHVRKESTALLSSINDDLAQSRLTISQDLLPEKSFANLSNNGMSPSPLPGHTTMDVLQNTAIVPSSQAPAYPQITQTDPCIYTNDTCHVDLVGSEQPLIALAPSLNHRVLPNGAVYRYYSPFLEAAQPIDMYNTPLEEVVDDTHDRPISKVLFQWRPHRLY